MLSAADMWHVTFRGHGGHGGLAPHLSTDITYVQAHFILALQGIIGRNVPPHEMQRERVARRHRRHAVPRFGDAS